MACELGKYPSEIEASMSMDEIEEFAAYLSIINPPPQKDEDVEDKLCKSLGVPK